MEALFKAQLNAGDMAVIGITNQRETTLLWKLTGGRVHATDDSNAARTLLFDLWV